MLDLNDLLMKADGVGQMMKKGLLLVVVGFGIVFWLGYSFYQYAVADYQRDLTIARDIAFSKTNLVQIEGSYSFSGEEHYFVFKGIDQQNQGIWVWVTTEGETHTEYAKDNADQNEIKQAALEHDPEAEIMRIIPGKLGNTWAWEVFYKKPNDDRYYYLYFDFKTGDLLRSYRLNRSIGS